MNDQATLAQDFEFFQPLRLRMHPGGQAIDLTESDLILGRLHEEILATTRLPLAIQFLATELKHTGELASGFARLPHYFTPFQAYVIGQAEREGQRFSLPTALLILEREATYRTGSTTAAGLFVYQFESLSRNRLGFAEGLTAM